MNVYTITFIMPDWTSRNMMNDPYDSFYTGRGHNTVISFLELHAVVLDYFRAECKEHHIDVQHINVQDKVIAVMAEGFGSEKTPTAKDLQVHLETAVSRAFIGLQRLYCNYVGQAFGLNLDPEDNDLTITPKE